MRGLKGWRRLLYWDCRYCGAHLRGDVMSTTSICLLCERRAARNVQEFARALVEEDPRTEGGAAAITNAEEEMLRMEEEAERP